jgi:hypothetical protein
MQDRYRVCLPLASTDRAVERLAELCGAWRQIPLADTKKLETGHQWEDAMQSVESRLVVLPSGFVWGLRHRIRDHEDPALQWMTDIGLAVEHDSAWLSVGNHIATSEHAPPRPIVRPRTRPRIVPDAIREFGCKLPIGPNVRTLDAESESIRSFLTELYDPQRRYPILFVSCRNETDRPVAHVSELGDWLSGIASVVVAKNRFPSRRLSEYLPPSLNCWDGAVRLYWPGLNAMDPPHMHRVWRAEMVREHDGSQNDGDGFKNLLLGRICDLLAHRRLLRFVDWPTLERLAAEQEMHAAVGRAKAEGKQDELLALFETDNLRLSQQLREVSEDRDTLQDRVDTLETERDYWREQARSASGGIVTVDAENFVPQTVAEAVDWAEAKLSSQLAFALNNKSDRNTPYGWPQEVGSGLQWLATTYRDAKLGIRRCMDLDRSIKEGCEASWFWKGGQSEITVTSFSNWYECTYQGQRHEVREHIGTGKSKRPEETIRIAFKWLESEEKVLIGYIGQHQRTTTT